MKNIKKSLLSLGLGVAVLLGSTSALAAKTTRTDVSVGTPTMASVAPVAGNQATWQKQAKPSVSIGQWEEFTLPFSVPTTAPFGDLSIAVQSSSLDLSQGVMYLVVDQNGSLFPVEISTNWSNNTLTAIMKTDAIARQSNSQCYIYVSAPRTATGGTATMTVSRIMPSSFTATTTVSVGDYEITKQGSGAQPIEMAAGASGLLSVDAIYCISKDNKEVIRILVQKGAVMGLAIKSNDIVAGVEYSLQRKVYINSLTKEAVLSKDDLIDVFNTLEFSFMKDPNETTWFQAQQPLSVQRTLTF